MRPAEPLTCVSCVPFHSLFYFTLATFVLLAAVSTVNHFLAYELNTFRVADIEEGFTEFNDPLDIYEETQRLHLEELKAIEGRLALFEKGIVRLTCNRERDSEEDRRRLVDSKWRKIDSPL